MPYIKLERQLELLKLRVKEYEGAAPPAPPPLLSPGDLAFLIADLIDDQLLALKATGGYRYADLATIDGVLGTAQHEFRRRVLDPYEDLARSINGEVYTALDE